jgi:hypothetical protein
MSLKGTRNASLIDLPSTRSVRTDISGRIIFLFFFSLRRYVVRARTIDEGLVDGQILMTSPWKREKTRVRRVNLACLL